MTESTEAAPAKIGEKTIDAEHDVQMQMLDSLSEELQKGCDLSPAKYLLDQFIEYSDMHFLSEQLVMRLHSYPGYEAHLDAHTRLLKMIRDIRQKVVQGEHQLSLQLVQELHDWLLSHIASKDVAFGEYLRKKESRKG